ncbi:MAG: cyclodeaminase/cyclohydrolase family protein, partial [Sediminibacterium sp.]|nr:cyclodeaminase/cyclohydrolase family protein [Sediminibacterium sp.]
MRELLLERKAKNLLNDFGTGGHEPGSGSAAAYAGSLAAQLICNVIDLTEKYKKRSKTYLAHIDQFLNYREILKVTILPRLNQLTEEDSIQFDKVIIARNARDEERNSKKKEALALLADRELRVATELPISIARYAYNVGRMAAEVFDYGYRGARGESAEGVCFSATVMLSCLFIIEANLQKLPVDEWTDKILAQKKKIENQQEELDKMGKERYLIIREETENHYFYERMVQKFRAGNLSDGIKTDKQLELLVT